MDEGGVTVFSGHPPWLTVAILALHLAAGSALGVLYFRNLSWNARLLADGERTPRAIGMMVGRFLLLGAALTLISLEGPSALLITALGVLVGRSMVMRRLKRELS